MDLSVLIPARNEQYLQKTIDSVLANSEADTEIVVVCDGYWPYEPIPDHPRVTVLHHTEARGQRQSQNEAARIARGKYLLKLDAHCAVSPGFDRILIESHRPGITQVPTMYNLDVNTWQPKLHKKTQYMYVGWNEKSELRTLYYNSPDWKRWHSRPQDFDETMSLMGPAFFLSKEDYWNWGGADEGHGGWGSQGIEVALKAWLCGEGLFVNKKCWFAHWFRGSDGGFPYPISGREVDHARKYSANLWTNNRAPGQKRSLEWLVRKFDPPGWEGYQFEPAQLPVEAPVSLDKREYYKYTVSTDGFPRWMGTLLVKYPGDILLYQEILYRNRPDYLIECGTYRGGSTLFFAQMMDLLGHGRVVSIDLHDHQPPQHPRVTYLVGRTTSTETLARVRELVPEGAKCMVVLDSDHRRSHVKRELHHYHGYVTPGQYLVVEDCNYGDLGKEAGPDEAVAWFLPKHREFVADPLENRFIFSLNPGGWLRRKG